jgi:hypothetical protein
MFRTLIGEKTNTELAYPAQPLKFGRVDKTGEKVTFGGVGCQPDYIVDRVAVYSFDCGAPNFVCF